MATQKFYSDAHPETTTVDGFVGRDNQSENLATIIAGAGNESGSTDAYIIVAYLQAQPAGDDGLYNEVVRGVYLFDVTAFAENPDTITGITLNFNVYVYTDNLLVGTFNVVGSTPASNTDLVNADYGQLGTTKYSGDIAIPTGAGWLSITLNAAGIAAVKTAIAGDKIVKLGTRLTCDGLGGTAPTWVASATSYIFCRSADFGSNEPYLEITYGISTKNKIIFGENF
jgi:hypothetical protein